MKLTLGFSPCPNDCYIFDALVHQKIDTGDLKFEVILEDVETLNRLALQSKLNITKLSFHAYAFVLNDYILLRSGSALGFNCGPLLVKKRNAPLPEQTEHWKVAIPGKLTTANFLMSMAYTDLKNKKELVFNQIEDAVLAGEVDAGLIIHENRFTYASKGLEKIRDLGEYWDSLTNAPIPLGGIAIQRMLPYHIQQQVNTLIKGSVEFAMTNPQSSMPYVKQHAQTMSESVMKQHIELYVNDFSVDLGVRGKKAVETMFNEAKQKGIFDYKENKLIID